MTKKLSFHIIIEVDDEEELMDSLVLPAIVKNKLSNSTNSISLSNYKNKKFVVNFQHLDNDCIRISGSQWARFVKSIEYPFIGKLYFKLIKENCSEVSAFNSQGLEFREDQFENDYVHAFLMEATDETWFKQDLPHAFLLDLNHRSCRLDNLTAKITGTNQDATMDVSYVYPENNRLGHASGFYGSNWTNFCFENEVEAGVQLMFINNRNSNFALQVFNIDGIGLDVVPLGLQLVNLGKNRFTGSVPAHLCVLLSINVLVLSNNNFSGILPKCLGNLTQLRVMDLTNNTIRGDIPDSLGSLSYLESLHFHNNKFKGSLPVALQNLTSLVTFDLGNNLLTGNIPSWIGKKLSKLRILNIQSNKFMGKIPVELCQNNALQHLNLANNSITGMIPRCFYNLTGMIMTSSDALGYIGYEENIEAYIKGIQLKYTKTIGFLISLDLSSNKSFGEIPDVLMYLVALKNLNLSRNLLSGQIPATIGNLKQMESLDLSTNKLFGRIPPSLASLNFLSYLNLSLNNLSGPIPTGNQLQTFDDPAVYERNNGLCGFPLVRSCKVNNLSYTHVSDDKGKNGSQGFPWFYAGMVPGFVVGFMGLIGSLHFIRIWRVTYFEMIENVYAMLTASIIVTLARLKRKFFQ